MLSRFCLAVSLSTYVLWVFAQTPCALCLCLPACLLLAGLSLPVCPLFTASASLLQAEHKGHASADLRSLQCVQRQLLPSVVPLPSGRRHCLSSFACFFPSLLFPSLPSLSRFLHSHCSTGNSCAIKSETETEAMSHPRFAALQARPVWLC